MTDAPELKPCPFCGGSKLGFQCHDIDGWAAHVVCRECDDVQGPMSAYKHDTTREAENDAAEMWNTRAAPRAKPLVWYADFAHTRLGVFYHIDRRSSPALYRVTNSSSRIAADLTDDDFYVIAQADYERLIWETLV